jgi:hypothetical protein
LGQALAEGGEIRALGLDDLARLFIRDGPGGLGVRHRQLGTGLQPVHVVAGEGIRVAAVEPTSIWSSDTPDWAWRRAMPDRVSPART